MELFENLLAYDKERNQIVSVLSITTSDLNGRTIGECALNNGYVTYNKNHIAGECILLPWTSQKDKDGATIHLDDLLTNDEIIFRVEWNKTQTCWWLKPIINNNMSNLLDKENEIFYLVLDNQQLGNGYFSRKDLKKIGNYHTDGKRLLKLQQDIEEINGDIIIEKPIDNTKQLIFDFFTNKKNLKKLVSCIFNEMDENDLISNCVVSIKNGNYIIVNNDSGFSNIKHKPNNQITEIIENSAILRINIENEIISKIDQKVIDFLNSKGFPIHAVFAQNFHYKTVFNSILCDYMYNFGIDMLKNEISIEDHID